MVKFKERALTWAPFSRKAMQAIKYSDAFINIYEGAVRSSKTVSSIIAFLEFLEESPHREFLLTGKTQQTAYRNVIGGDYGILSIVGANRGKFKSSGEGGAQIELKFKNPNKRTRRKEPWVTKIVYVVGMNDRQAEEKIRGMTIAGWYADEVTLYPEEAVKQAINRMSLDGARAFWTCNPDSPYHYIKTEYIDKAKEKGYRVFHFTLDDNMALSERYKNNLKLAYKGLWYKRMVLGLWVMADGVIYDSFVHESVDAGGMIVAKPPFEHTTRHWVGVDYGNTNPTVFLMLGEGTDGRLYLLDEYYHQAGGDNDNQSKAPSEYAKDFEKWLGECADKIPSFNLQGIFIDPSAKGFILELYRILPKQFKRKIRTANNDVKLGIEKVAGVIGNDLFRVGANHKNVLRELSSYVWDPKAQKRGEDKPIKENDHAMDALRYMIMGTYKIWENKIRDLSHRVA